MKMDIWVNEWNLAIIKVIWNGRLLFLILVVILSAFLCYASLTPTLWLFNSFVCVAVHSIPIPLTKL